MSVVLALAAAIGTLLIFQGLTGPPATRSSFGERRLRSLLEEAGSRRLTPAGLVGLCAMLGVGALMLVAGLSSSLIIAAVFAAAAAWTPVALLRARRLKRRGMFREAWPDAIAALVSGVRAGVSLPESCTGLVERGPADLAAGFASFTATYRATGSFQVALQRLRSDLSDPVADRVIAALWVAHDVGGTDLVNVLRTLGNFVREDLRVRKEIESRWSWTVTAARVAAAAPWIVLLLMSTRPEAAAAYNSESGFIVILGGAVSTLVGYRLMLRAARLPEQRRLGA